ncbi:hypothetical protein PVAND_015163 [Polypedilum vanderplanki]|uniref:Uncharacterized protein n=1 Tax=Polypedilum vanderplanki TaxID=319348 RepID=A0A9J6BC56_POLVA|nr:hypothetical protein PVAND_015163 [Polypedilum vanderplanki]
MSPNPSVIVSYNNNNNNNLSESSNTLNFKNASEVSTFISKNLQESDLNFFYLDIKIDEKLEKIKFENILNDKSILIVIQSEEDKRSAILWKNSESCDILCVKVDDKDDEEKNYLIQFLRTRLSSDVKVLKFNNCAHLYNVVDANGFNLLMESIQDGNKIFSKLLTHPFDINQKNKNGQSSVDIAWANQDYGFVYELLMANSKFPEKFNRKEASQEIINLLLAGEEMHEAAKTRSFKIPLIRSQFPNLLHFYNSKNISAIFVSASNKKLLSFQNILYGPEEKFKFDEENYLWKIYSRVFFGSNNRDEIVKIKQAFEKLNSTEFGKKFLEFASKNEKLKIHVDCRNNQDISNLAGQIACQVCHFALDKIFNYDGNPFRFNDHFNKSKFSVITEKCAKFDCDIISEVFELPNDQWMSEVITAVPQILIEFENEEVRLQEIKSKFPDLFDYFDKIMNGKICGNWKVNFVDNSLNLDDKMQEELKLVYDLKMFWSILAFLVLILSIIWGIFYGKNE